MERLKVTIRGDGVGVTDAQLAAGLLEALDEKGCTCKEVEIRLVGTTGGDGVAAIPIVAVLHEMECPCGEEFL
jgi:hypothetical protein